MPQCLFQLAAEGLRNGRRVRGLDRGLAAFFEGPVDPGHGQGPAVGVGQDGVGRDEALAPQVVRELPFKPFDELRRREGVQLDAAV